MCGTTLHPRVHALCVRYSLQALGCSQTRTKKTRVTVIWVTMKATWSRNLKSEHKTNDHASIARQAGSRLTPSNASITHASFACTTALCLNIGALTLRDHQFTSEVSAFAALWSTSSAITQSASERGMFERSTLSGTFCIYVPQH